MNMIGKDGLGYELACRLESIGSWRPWLGESSYSNFIYSLNSPSSWESFILPSPSKSTAQIHLILRVRSLLFDKSLLSPYTLDLSTLNPNYLKLHGDDVYYTLEHPHSAPLKPKIQAKAAFSGGSRYGGSEVDNISQRARQDELPESWYTQFIEKYRDSTPYKLSLGDREFDKRTPEDMAAYLRHFEKYKRRRGSCKQDQCLVSKNPILENKVIVHSSSILDSSDSVDDDTPFFPETMYSWNCVPDVSLPPRNIAEDRHKIDFYGVFDTLPRVMSKNSIMIERLVNKPESPTVDQGGKQHRVRNVTRENRKHLGHEQAYQICKKVIAHMLINAGFEGGTEVPIGVLSQLLSCHISKLGRTLKVLADNYRKQCSASELIKMFLYTSGHSNIRVLAEHVKDTNKSTLQQAQQQVQVIPSQMQPQHPTSQTQQIPRLHPMQQMLNTQHLAFQQQQWERIRRQASTAIPIMNMDNKDKPLLEVKLENAPDLPLDSNPFNNFNNKHPQIQMCQQIPTVSNFQAPQGNQMRQHAPQQVPQTPSMGGPNRAPPVKVEGFQDLFGGGGGDSSKHDLEENRLTSPK